MAKFGTNASGILFSWRDNSSYRLHTLGPLCLWQCLFVFLVVFLSAMMTLVEKVMEKLPENGNLPPLGRELSPGSALCVLSPTTSDNHMIVTIYLLCSFDEL